MANNIKGITIQLDADGSQFEQTLKEVESQSKSLSSELSQINRQLKFDPSDTVLLKQKFDVLSQQVDNTRKKLQTLEAAQEQVQEKFENGEISPEQYRAFQREVQKTQNYLEYLEEQQEETAGAFNQELSSQYDELQVKIDDANAHLEELKSQQEQFSDADIDSEEYVALQDNIAQAEAELENLQTQSDLIQGQMQDLGATANDLGIDLQNVGSKAQDSSDGMGKAEGESTSLADALQKASGMAGIFGGAIGGIMSGGVDGLLEVIPQLVEKVIEVAMAFDEANSVIVEKTGASGEALEEFNQIAAETAIAMDGLDVAGAAGVVGELNTRLDLTGQELETATVLVGKFADVTGTDAEKAVAQLNGVMKAWGVETSDMGSLLDKLVVAGQKSGIEFSSLATTLTDNKYIFNDLGLSIDESIGMLSAFEKNGIKSTTAMMGFRTAMSKWAKEGKTSAQGFAELSASIQNATSSQEANNLAIEYFGTRAGGLIADAIRTNRLAFDDMTEAIQNSNGALIDTEERAQTFSENMEQIGDTVSAFGAEGGPIGVLIDATNNTGAFGTAIHNAMSELFGLKDAEQAIVDQDPALEEAHQKEAERLQKQAEFEALASGGYQQMSTNMDAIKAKIEELDQQYQENYDTAYENISGSIGLFEDMTIESGKSVGQMIESLKSQTRYMDNYASNMKRAAELGVDEGLLRKLSDGSKESAAILQSIVDDGGEHIGELNTEFAKVEEGKEQFANTYATMATDFDTSMRQIETRMGLAVDRMDQYDEAYNNGSDTVKGFIKGSESHYTEIYNAYKKVAEQANRAVKRTLDIHSPSRVMMKLGEYTAEGFAEGALDELSTVQNAFMRMAQVPMSIDEMGSMAVTKTNRVVSVNAPIQVLQRLDDAEIQRAGNKITDIVGRQFAKRTGGVL